jgi:DNA-binding NarL/FixJ family response regulator
VIRVVLADDHHLVRQGICALLDKSGDIEVIGEAADGYEAIELARRLHPDVLVMDLAMPRLSGNQAVERICAMGLSTRVVVLSMYSDETLVRQMLRNGATGYLLKCSVMEELLLAIRAANRGETYLSPAISGAIVTDYLTSQKDIDASSPFEQLTPREREVLQLICEGHTNTGIAHMLKISVKTVEKHRSNVMSKLDAHDVAGLVRAAIRHKLVFLDK